MHGQKTRSSAMDASCVHAVGNVHFDNRIYYKVNEAYLEEVDIMEERVSAAYESLLDSNNIDLLLLEYPVYYEQNLNFILHEGFDSIAKYVDTLEFPATFNELKRINRLLKRYPSLRFRCIDISESKDREYFMSSLVYLLFSSHEQVDRRYTYSDHLAWNEYLEMWEDYNRILESIPNSDSNLQYRRLLRESLEVMFMDLSQRSKVKDLVEDFKAFIEENPHAFEPNVVRLINSYRTSRRDNKALREMFLYDQVMKALDESSHGHVLLELGFWHLERDEEENLYAKLKTKDICVEIVKMYYPIYDKLYKEEENEMYESDTTGMIELFDNYYINYPDTNFGDR